MRPKRASSKTLLALIALMLGTVGLPPRDVLAAGPAVAPSDTIDPLSDLENRFKDVADKVAPAVVAISASTHADNSPSACRSEEMSSDKLQAFLSKTTRIVGTGFIVGSDGYILTNDHVIDEAEQLWITTDDHHVYPAIIVGSDPRSDLAVLKIPGHQLPTVHFGNGGAIRRGQWSIAIGNPFGLSGQGGMCVSVGVVSAINRSLPKLSDTENRLYTNLIQTTAQINPGNSGGPLFDLHGDVIGINTAVVMPQKSVNGIGFAMPIDRRLLYVVDQLKAGNEVVYGYLGVIVGNPTEHDRRAAGLQQAIGARVENVEPDSPASDGKIRENDLIIAIDGQAVNDSDAFVRIVGTSSVATPISVTVVREGRTFTESVTLRKRQLPVAAVTRENQRLRWGGMLLGALPSDHRERGLIVLDIDSASPFTRLGLHEGSVINTIAGRSVDGVTELQGIINDTPFDKCAIGVAPDLTTASISSDR